MHVRTHSLTRGPIRTLHRLLVLKMSRSLKQIRNDLVCALAANGCTTKQIRVYILKECGISLRYVNFIRRFSISTFPLLTKPATNTENY